MGSHWQQAVLEAVEALKTEEVEVVAVAVMHLCHPVPGHHL